MFFFMTMLKAADWQRWISLANPKGRASGKKSYAVCIIGSPWYYEIWVLKPQSDTQYSQQRQCVHENLLRKCLTLINRRNIVLLYDNAKPHSARITQEKNIKWSVLPHPPNLPDVAPSDFHLFFFSTKCFKWQKMFSRRSGKNICRKFLEFENSWILLERNQQATW